MAILSISKETDTYEVRRCVLLNMDGARPGNNSRLKIERDNVTMQNEEQIIISSFKASISAI